MVSSNTSMDDNISQHSTKITHVTVPDLSLYLLYLFLFALSHLSTHPPTHLPAYEPIPTLPQTCLSPPSPTHPSRPPVFHWARSIVGTCRASLPPYTPIHPLTQSLTPIYTHTHTHTHARTHHPPTHTHTHLLI